MNATNISDSEIESYLLGAVEGKTAESIDELAFTDEEFASRVGAVERDLVDEYIRKELDLEKLRRFESYYLRSEKRRERVRLSRSFGEFVASAVPPKEHPIRAEPGKETETRWKGLRWKFAIPAFAVVILLAVALPFLFNWTATQESANGNVDPGPSNVQRQDTLIADVVPTPEPPSPLPTQAPANRRTNDNALVAPPAPRAFALSLSPQMRGAQGEKSVSIPSGTDDVAVTLQLEPTEFTSVRVELRSQESGRSIWNGRARPSGSGAYQLLRFRFAKRLLGPGRYSIVASGVSNEGEAEVIGDYPFRIVP